MTRSESKRPKEKKARRSIGHDEGTRQHLGISNRTFIRGGSLGIIFFLLGVATDAVRVYRAAAEARVGPGGCTHIKKKHISRSRQDREDSMVLQTVATIYQKESIELREGRAGSQVFLVIRKPVRMETWNSGWFFSMA